jgi:hypothetical protein
MIENYIFKWYVFWVSIPEFAWKGVDKITTLLPTLNHLKQIISYF